MSFNAVNVIKQKLDGTIKGRTCADESKQKRYLSAIHMEKNGRNSCTGNSRHIHIIYFFVKDIIYKGEMRVEYCPTHLLLADLFTKPLMG